jgi:hypothetical protein
MGDKVYLFVITASEPIKPDTLDIVGYQHDYWPGMKLATEDDYQGAHIVEDTFIVDELLSFRVTMVRVAHGERGDGTVTFDPAFARVLSWIDRGVAREGNIVEDITKFASADKERIGRLQADDDVIEFIQGEIDAELRLLR